MNLILLDDVWQRKGISVIWDNPVLAKLVKDNRLYHSASSSLITRTAGRMMTCPLSTTTCF